MSESTTTADSLYTAVNSARILIERFRVRPGSTFLLADALRELDDAADLMHDRLELLGACGDGSAETPWDMDALVAYAKAMRS